MGRWAGPYSLPVVPAGTRDGRPSVGRWAGPYCSPVVPAGTRDGKTVSGQVGGAIQFTCSSSWHQGWGRWAGPYSSSMTPGTRISTRDTHGTTDKRSKVVVSSVTEGHARH